MYVCMHACMYVVLMADILIKYDKDVMMSYSNIDMIDDDSNTFIENVKSINKGVQK